MRDIVDEDCLLLAVFWVNPKRYGFPIKSRLDYGRWRTNWQEYIL